MEERGGHLLESLSIYILDNIEKYGQKVRGMVTLLLQSLTASKTAGHRHDPFEGRFKKPSR